MIIYIYNYSIWLMMLTFNGDFLLQQLVPVIEAWRSYGLCGRFAPRRWRSTSVL